MHPSMHTKSHLVLGQHCIASEGTTTKTLKEPPSFPSTLSMCLGKFDRWKKKAMWNWAEVRTVVLCHAQHLPPAPHTSKIWHGSKPYPHARQCDIPTITLLASLQNQPTIHAPLAPLENQSISQIQSWNGKHINQPPMHRVFHYLHSDLY